MLETADDTWFNLPWLPRLLHQVLVFYLGWRGIKSRHPDTFPDYKKAPDFYS